MLSIQFVFTLYIVLLWTLCTNLLSFYDVWHSF